MYSHGRGVVGDTWCGEDSLQYIYIYTHIYIYIYILIHILTDTCTLMCLYMFAHGDTSLRQLAAYCLSLLGVALLRPLGTRLESYYSTATYATLEGTSYHCNLAL